MNNYGATDIDDILALVPDTAKYIIVGEEVGEQGTPHLQGYAVFNSNKRLSAVTKLLPGCHVAASRGTAQQNIVYCSKDGVTHTAGTPPMDRAAQVQSQKDRYALCRRLAEQGKFDEIEPVLYMRYRTTIHAIYRDHQPKLPTLDGPLEHIWLCGPAGAGKSRMARELAPDAYVKTANTQWWDGYKDEADVIIDDLDPYMVKLSHSFKIWADRYPFQAEMKGSSRLIRPRRIIVTSQYHPSQIWKAETDLESLEAIERRFNIKYVRDGAIVE